MKILKTLKTFEEHKNVTSYDSAPNESELYVPNDTEGIYVDSRNVIIDGEMFFDVTDEIFYFEPWYKEDTSYEKQSKNLSDFSDIFTPEGLKGIEEEVRTIKKERKKELDDHKNRIETLMKTKYATQPEKRKYLNKISRDEVEEIFVEYNEFNNNVDRVFILVSRVNGLSEYHGVVINDKKKAVKIAKKLSKFLNRTVDYIEETRILNIYPE